MMKPSTTKTSMLQRKLQKQTARILPNRDFPNPGTVCRVKLSTPRQKAGMFTVGGKERNRQRRNGTYSTTLGG